MGVGPYVAGGARVFHAERRVAGPRVEQAGGDPQLSVAGRGDLAAHDPVDAQLAPPVEGQIRERPGAGDGVVDVARHHPELALELEIAPQHLGDRACGLRDLLVAADRQAIGNGERRLRADAVADDQVDLRLLAGRRLQRRRRAGLHQHEHACTECHTQDRKSPERKSIWDHRRYSNVRRTVRLGSVKAEGSPGSWFVNRMARWALMSRAK